MQLAILALLCAQLILAAAGRTEIQITMTSERSEATEWLSISTTADASLLVFHLDTKTARSEASVMFYALGTLTHEIHSPPYATADGSSSAYAVDHAPVMTNDDVPALLRAQRAWRTHEVNDTYEKWIRASVANSLAHGLENAYLALHDNIQCAVPIVQGLGFVSPADLGRLNLEDLLALHFNGDHKPWDPDLLFTTLYSDFVFYFHRFASLAKPPTQRLLQSRLTPAPTLAPSSAPTPSPLPAPSPAPSSASSSAASSAPTFSTSLPQRLHVMDPI